MGFWEIIFAKIIVKILIGLPILFVWVLIVKACRGTVLTKDIFTGKQLLPKETDVNKRMIDF